jgi:DNA adenine methylase
MRYLGGKHRQSKEIARHIAEVSDGDYWEPFMGGGSVAAAVARTQSFDTMHLSDAHTDLVLMWQALLDGWLPPERVSLEEWQALKGALPSAERGFVGFACSFAGKWFSSYAVDSRPSEDAAGAGARGLAKKVAALLEVGTVSVTHQSYDAVAPVSGDVLYLDPPYANTAGYSTGSFDSAAFWSWAQRHAEGGVHVFVSEFTAPDGWVPVWSVERTAIIRPHNRKKAVEHLYSWEGS